MGKLDIKQLSNMPTMKYVIKIILIISLSPLAYSGDDLSRISIDNISEYSNNLTTGQVLFLRENPSKSFRISESGLFSPVINQDYVPFENPKTGEEVIWNHLKRYRGAVFKRIENEEVYLTNKEHYSKTMIQEHKYNYVNSNEYHSSMWQITAPPRRKGEIILRRQKDLQSKYESDLAWQYLPGTRRVRRAQILQYDFQLLAAYPKSLPGNEIQEDFELGIIKTIDNFDMFNGSLELFSWRLLPQKEIYIPITHTYSQLETRENVDDLMNFQLKSVVVVEASLIDGKEHSFKKRRYYIDPDTWQILIAEHYKGLTDNDVEVISIAFPLYFNDEKMVLTDSEIHFNLRTGGYANYFYNHYEFFSDKEYPDTYFRPRKMRPRVNR